MEIERDQLQMNQYHCQPIMNSRSYYNDQNNYQHQCYSNAAEDQRGEFLKFISAASLGDLKGVDSYLKKPYA